MKKVNWFKVIALILLIVEVIIATVIDKNAIKENLNLWRLYVACVMFIPVNVIFISIKQKRRK